MGNELFGVDIAGLIHQHISPGVNRVVLRQFTNQKRAGILEPPIPRPSDNECRGFIEHFADDKIDNQNILRDDRIVTIIGDSLPDGVIPKTDDRVTVYEDGVAEPPVYRVLDLIDRDPAAATYQIHARI